MKPTISEELFTIAWENRQTQLETTKVTGVVLGKLKCHYLVGDSGFDDYDSAELLAGVTGETLCAVEYAEVTPRVIDNKVYPSYSSFVATDHFYTDSMVLETLLLFGGAKAAELLSQIISYGPQSARKYATILAYLLDTAD